SGTGRAGGATAGATAPGEDLTGTRQGEAGEGGTQATTEQPEASAQATERSAQAPQRSYGYGFPDHEQAPAPGGAGATADGQAATADGQAATADGQAPRAAGPETNGEVRASPMARRIARERGI